MEIIKDGHLQSTCIIIIRRNAALKNAAFTAEIRRGARPHDVHTGAAYSSRRLRKSGEPAKAADAFCTLQKAASGVSDAFSELQNTAQASLGAEREKA
ncbi:hypothetical protein [Sutterella wadsworthensis]|uniref:hypothetical protein n=1 Tax=Sutterella wadsworthensis TaxID=40545 RepID=UPI003FEE4101